MTSIRNEWKFFALALLVGVAVALGLRSRGTAPAGHARSGSDEPMQHEPMQHEPAAAPAAPGLLVDLGNAICPINREAVDGSTYAEWNGIRVGFCCPGCDRKFLAKPEQALDEAGIDWKELRDALDRYRAAPDAHKAHLLEAIRKQWKILREPSR